MSLIYRLEELCPKDGAKVQLFINTEVSVFKFSETLSGSIGESAEKQARLRKLITVTKRLGKSTVAKRVNDPALSRALGAYGVDFVQSHSASAPCPLESLMVTRAAGR